MMVSQAAEAGWRSSLLVRRARLKAAGNLAENNQHQIERKGWELKELDIPRIIIGYGEGWFIWALHVGDNFSRLFDGLHRQIRCDGAEKNIMYFRITIFLSEFGLRPEKTLWEGPYDPCDTKNTESETLCSYVHLVPLRGWIAILSEKQRGPGISGAVTGADLFSR